MKNNVDKKDSSSSNSHILFIVKIKDRYIILVTNLKIEAYNIENQDLFQNIEINNKHKKLITLENNIKYFISNFLRKILNKRDYISLPTIINPNIIYL